MILKLSDDGKTTNVMKNWAPYLWSRSKCLFWKSVMCLFKPEPSQLDLPTSNCTAKNSLTPSMLSLRLSAFATIQHIMNIGSKTNFCVVNLPFKSWLAWLPINVKCFQYFPAIFSRFILNQKIFNIFLCAPFCAKRLSICVCAVDIFIRVEIDCWNIYLSFFFQVIKMPSRSKPISAMKYDAIVTGQIASVIGINMQQQPSNAHEHNSTR